MMPSIRPSNVTPMQQGFIFAVELGPRPVRNALVKFSNDILKTDRPVITLADEYPAGFVDPMHSHGHIQVLYASSGVMSVRTSELSFVVPPQRAVWIPVDVPHEVQCRGPVSLRTLYLRPDLGRGDEVCRVFEVSDFLRALILETIRFDPAYDDESREGRIVSLLLEEIERMPNAPYHVAMPSNPRLLKVCEALRCDPSDPRDIDEWAREIGMGRRTFTRAFKAETGMGFAVWRQQVRLMEALSLLANGMSVTRIAYEVGYDSPSGFSAMFRRAFGVPPSQYLMG